MEAALVPATTRTDELNEDPFSSRHWDQTAIDILQSPSLVGLIASFGYMGHLILTGKPMTRRRIIGGAMLSIFVSIVTYSLASGLGMNEKMAVGLAMLIGSLGETGYVALSNRGLSLLEKDHHPQ